MIWRFSDGTVATLGGEIEGATLFAQELRETLLQPDLQIALWPHPSELTPLNVNDAAHFDFFLRQELGKPYRRAERVRMTERPKDIPELPPPPWGEDDGLSDSALA